jgi:hypothetical protein
MKSYTFDANVFPISQVYMMCLLMTETYDQTLLGTCFHAGFLLSLFFDPEDGGNTRMLLRNIG